MKRYKTALWTLLALLALAAAAFLFTLAQGAVLDLKGRSQRSQGEALRRQQQDFAALAAEHGEWRALPAALEEFRRRHVISLDGFARFRRELNLCIDDNGLPAPNIAFRFGPVRDGMQAVSFQFTLEGSYRSLKKFIYDMERKPNMQFFTAIDLSGAGSAVRGRFVMEAYLAD